MDSPNSSPICPGGSCNERWTCGEVAPKRRQVHEFAPWAHNSLIPQTDRSVDSDSRRRNGENYTCRRDQLSSLCDQGLRCVSSPFIAKYIKQDHSRKSQEWGYCCDFFSRINGSCRCAPRQHRHGSGVGIGYRRGVGTLEIRWDWNSVTSGADMCMHHAFLHEHGKKSCVQSLHQENKTSTPFRRCTCPSVCRRLIA